MIEKVVIAECKVVEALVPVHTRQVKSYMKTAGVRLGLIFNFNVDVLMRQGFKRVVL